MLHPWNTHVSFLQGDDDWRAQCTSASFRRSQHLHFDVQGLLGSTGKWTHMETKFTMCIRMCQRFSWQWMEMMIRKVWDSLWQTRRNEELRSTNHNAEICREWSPSVLMYKPIIIHRNIEQHYQDQPCSGCIGRWTSWPIQNWNRNWFIHNDHYSGSVSAVALCHGSFSGLRWAVASEHIGHGDTFCGCTMERAAGRFIFPVNKMMRTFPSTREGEHLYRAWTNCSTCASWYQGRAHLFHIVVLSIKQLKYDAMDWLLDQSH